MKNISKILVCGFMGLLLASCDGDYENWSNPQQNQEEEAIVLPTFTATAAPAIDFDQVKTETVSVFTLNDATLPEGFELGNGRVDLAPQGVANATKTSVAVSAQGAANTQELLDAVIAAYGKRPVARAMEGTVYLNAVKDGQAVLVNAGNIVLSLTPRASEYTSKYYIVGAMQGWSTDAKTCMFYPNSASVQSYTTKFEGDANLKIWSEDTFGDWGKALGAATDGDNSVSGKLVSENAGAMVCPEKGAFYTLSIDFDAMTYTWTKCDNQNPTEYTLIGLIGGFNNWGGDEAMTQVTPHNWTANITIAEDTELKFRADGGWDVNWGAGLNVAETYYGVGTAGGDNIKVPAGTYNVFFNDITGEFAFVAE